MRLKHGGVVWVRGEGMRVELSGELRERAWCLFRILYVPFLLFLAYKSMGVEVGAYCVRSLVVFVVLVRPSAAFKVPGALKDTGGCLVPRTRECTCSYV